MGFLKKLTKGAKKLVKASVNPLSLLKRKKAAQKKVFTAGGVFGQSSTAPKFKGSRKWDF